MTHNASLLRPHCFGWRHLEADWMIYANCLEPGREAEPMHEIVLHQPSETAHD
jgi:hypothetical protein